MDFRFVYLEQDPQINTITLPSSLLLRSPTSIWLTVADCAFSDATILTQTTIDKQSSAIMLAGNMALFPDNNV